MPTLTERALTAGVTAGAAFLLGCEGPTAPPSGAVRFEPPAHFEALWTETEQCSGSQRPFAAVRWYQVPDAWQVPNHAGRLVAGFYDIAGDYVVIAGAYMTSDPLVRHESLHAILDTPDHSVEFDLCDLRLEE